MTWSIEHHWNGPTWLTVLLLLGAAAPAVGLYWRETTRRSRGMRLALAVIRFTLIAMLLGMIARPALVWKRTAPPPLVVLLDDSRSMAIADRYPESTRRAMADRLKDAGLESDDASRWNLARALLLERGGALPRALAEKYDLRIALLSEAGAVERNSFRSKANGARPPSAVEDMTAQPGAAVLHSQSPDADATRLGGGVRDAMDATRGAVPAAIVLLTDGVNTQGPALAEAADDARLRGVPLFCIGLGLDRPARGLMLSDLLADEAIFAGDPLEFECRLTPSGLEGQDVSVVLRREGDTAVLARAEATAGPDGQSQRVRLVYRPPETGRLVYVLEPVSSDGGAPLETNRLTHTVRIRKETLRVLLVASGPSYEFRYLSNMLRREPTIDLKYVLQEADPEFLAADPSALGMFPLNREELFAFDAVILDDADPALLGHAAMKHLAEFVDRPAKGGALVLIAGPRFLPEAYGGAPLERLLPFNGERPPSAVVEPFSRPGAAVLPDKGFFVQPTELGLSDPALQLGDDPEESRAIWRRLAPLYWIRPLGALKPGARILGQTATGLGPDGPPLPVIVLHYIGAGQVLFHATDETWRWRLGAGDVYFARYWLQAIRRLCRAKLAESDGATLSADHRAPAAGEFAAASPSDELAQTRMDSAELRRAAERTGGRFYTFETADRLLSDLPTGRRSVVETLPPRPLWNAWPVLATFFALLVAEWVLRKRGGMV